MGLGSKLMDARLFARIKLPSRHVAEGPARAAHRRKAKGSAFAAASILTGARTAGGAVACPGHKGEKHVYADL
jgi:hypothetical protein